MQSPTPSPAAGHQHHAVDRAVGQLGMRLQGNALGSEPDLAGLGEGGGEG